jgi:two-component system sensor histidine kinase UhpB
MRHAIAIAAMAVVLAVAIGMHRIQDAIDDEVDGAMALASLVARLGSLAQTDDRSALESLRAMQADGIPRHLELSVHAADGQLLLAPPTPAASRFDALAALHRQVFGAVDHRSVSWRIARPDATAWTVSLHATPEGERLEGLADLTGIFLILLGCIAGLLLAMRWNLRRAFAPLTLLLDAIGGIENDDLAPVRRLPTMPIRELEAVAAALRHLAEALAQAQMRRRALSRQVLTLQEDERTHLARELHDELGQHLTALRFDAAWLQRQLAAQPTLASVVATMAERCGNLQREVRQMLVRLRPLRPLDDTAGALEVARLTEMLVTLVASWRSPDAGSATCSVDLVVQPPASDAHGPPVRLPMPLALGVYRISQEALTNVARHARATRATLTLRIDLAADRRSGCLHWRVQDDGVGLPDIARALPRGNGLGGMQERVWALGGQWRLDGDAGGLTLTAELPFDVPDGPEARDETTA